MTDFAALDVYLKWKYIKQNLW